MFRVGIGYDIHRLVRGRKLFIGGVNIPFTKGLLGHSDGDVLLHAISDALLGALGDGDIGTHFPDTDPVYKGIASAELLKKVMRSIRRRGYIVNNVDTIVIAQEPRLFEFRERIRMTIGEILGVKNDRVSVKAKTNEGMGEIGAKRAIAAYATVVIKGRRKR